MFPAFCGSSLSHNAGIGPSLGAPPNSLLYFRFLLFNSLRQIVLALAGVYQPPAITINCSTCLPPRLHLHPVGESVVQTQVVLPADLPYEGVAPLRISDEHPQNRAAEELVPQRHLRRQRVLEEISAHARHAVSRVIHPALEREAEALKRISYQSARVILCLE
jgi:hypothetical protein